MLFIIVRISHSLSFHLLFHQCHSAFNGCTNLESVVYHGTNDPLEQNEKEVFSGCNQLIFVCVPSSYSYNSFCNVSQICKHETCESFLHNQCFEDPVCNDNGTITMKKRENATIWEHQSNPCYDYKCHNDSGALTVEKRENATEWESKMNGCYKFQCYNGSAI